MKRAALIKQGYVFPPNYHPKEKRLIGVLNVAGNLAALAAQHAKSDRDGWSKGYNEGRAAAFGFVATDLAEALGIANEIGNTSAKLHRESFQKAQQQISGAQH